jgi:CRISPR-associated RAMP protein (TIGR02581 family)
MFDQLMFDQLGNRLTISGQIVTCSALHVGSGRTTDPTAPELPLLRDDQGRPFIPGASFKGVLRSNVEALVRAVVRGRRRGACEPFVTEEEEDAVICLTAKKVSDLKREEELKDNDKALTEAILTRLCMVCLTFGSPWLAGHLSVADLLVDEDFWSGRVETRHGVAIDRDTGTAAPKKLYAYEVVPAGFSFNLSLTLENAEDWQRGMVLAGLLPFIRGEGAVGGFTSRGLGWARLDEGYSVRYWEGNGADSLLELALGLTVGGEIPRTRQQKWVKAFRDELRHRAQKEAA